MQRQAPSGYQTDGAKLRTGLSSTDLPGNQVALSSGHTRGVASANAAGAGHTLASPDRECLVTDDDRVPQPLRRAAAIGWRLLVVGAVVYFAFQALRPIAVVVLAGVIALFPASLLWGPVQSLKRRGWPPVLATWAVLLASLAAAVGLGMLVIPALADGIEPVTEDVATAYDDLRLWLVEGPLGLSQAEVDQYADMILDQLQASAGRLTTGFLSGAALALEILTGAILAFIITFFLLKDGDRFLSGLLQRLPSERSHQVQEAGRVAWRTLNRYVQGLAVVGLIDAAAIGIGLWILGIPLVVPLSILVFIGAFFPVVGAFLSGLVAVAVALVNGGVTDALIVLAIIVAIQQLEGDVIYPLVFGRAVQLHPLVILLAIAAGGFAFGVAGVFLSVPLTAVIVAVNHTLSDDPHGSLLGLAKSFD